MAAKKPFANLGAITDGANLKANLANEFVKLDVSKLDPNPHQPRADEGDVDELMQSIQNEGLLQPISVCAGENGRYTLLFGHRRLKAHKLLGLKKIQARVVEADDVKLFNVAMMENWHRSDLSPIEYAQQFDKALKEGRFASQDALCLALGISKSKLSKILSVLKLDEALLEAVKNDKEPLGYTTLAELSKAPKEAQGELYAGLKSKTLARDTLKSKETPKKELQEVTILTVKRLVDGTISVHDVGLDALSVHAIIDALKKYKEQ